ncbi:hypothetical protein C8J57DRAFT_1499540 [Mycena rebaudengoi]|nr:hypothetical protein C8J57DRAFT_1499540 [Mycena rebaudengoi]
MSSFFAPTPRSLALLWLSSSTTVAYSGPQLLSNALRPASCRSGVMRTLVHKFGDRTQHASIGQLMQQTRYTVRTFGIWRNEKLAVHVTIRGALRPWHRHLWHGLLRRYGPPGARVARRRQQKARIGFLHRIKKDDTTA